MTALSASRRPRAATAREPVLVNIDLELGEGDFVGIVGPSGSGKTTLLRAIAGAVRPIAGRIVRERRRRVGYVPQVETVNWYFPVTVREAVLMSRFDGRVVPVVVEERPPGGGRGPRASRDGRARRTGTSASSRAVSSSGCSSPGRCCAGRSPAPDGRADERRRRSDAPRRDAPDPRAAPRRSRDRPHDPRPERHRGAPPEARLPEPGGDRRSAARRTSSRPTCSSGPTAPRSRCSQHGGMPVVIERYAEDEPEDVGAAVVPLREGHHGHPA